MEEEGLASPLLSNHVNQEPQKRARSYSYTKDEILTEFKKQLYLAGPLMTINLLICGLSMISVMFVGHLGELALSGASMATSFASVTGTSLMVSSSSSFISSSCLHGVSDINQFLKPSSILVLMVNRLEWGVL